MLSLAPSHSTLVPHIFLFVCYDRRKKKQNTHTHNGVIKVKLGNFYIDFLCVMLLHSDAWVEQKFTTVKAHSTSHFFPIVPIAIFIPFFHCYFAGWCTTTITKVLAVALAITVWISVRCIVLSTYNVVI